MPEKSSFMRCVHFHSQTYSAAIEAASEQLHHHICGTDDPICYSLHCFCHRYIARASTFHVLWDNIY